MILVFHTRKLIETLRDDKWYSFLGGVIDLCKKPDVDIPNFDAPHSAGRNNRKRDHITNEHYYHFDIYNETIDFQLQEIDTRFNEKLVELLELSAALDLRERYKFFKVYAIYKLAKKYYFLDFTEQDLDVLEFQLKHFEVDVKDHPLLGNMSSLAERCQGLTYSGKASHYYLVDRLIRLVLTLPVSTATIERAFSAMKIMKNRLRNRMDDEFISDSEKDNAKTFTLYSILNDFIDVRERHVLTYN